MQETNRLKSSIRKTSSKPITSLKNCDINLLKSLETPCTESPSGSKANETSQCLYLFNEGIIATQDLFSLISSRLQELAFPETESTSITTSSPTVSPREPTSEKIATLLQFCTCWVAENASTLLIQKAEEPLNNIIKTLQNHPVSSIRDGCQALRSNLTFALTPRKHLQPERPPADKQPIHQEDFNDILQDICKNKSAEHCNKQAEKIAADLFLWHGLLFKDLSTHNLIENKWEEKPTPSLHML